MVTRLVRIPLGYDSWLYGKVISLAYYVLAPFRTSSKAVKKPMPVLEPAINCQKKGHEINDADGHPLKNIGCELIPESLLTCYNCHPTYPKQRRAFKVAGVSMEG
jgi:hypothetical protein